MLDGLAPACARARRLASTIRHPNPHICSLTLPNPSRSTVSDGQQPSSRDEPQDAPGGEPAWFERLLELALQTNAVLWTELEQAGLADAELALAFLFVAPGEAEAGELEAFLRAETDYELRAHSQREHEAAELDWFVVGVTRPAALTRATVDAWVEWMIAAGAAHGPCAFDGWAPQVDRPAPPG